MNMQSGDDEKIDVDDYIDKYLNEAEPPFLVQFRFMYRVCRESGYFFDSLTQYIDLSERYWLGYGVSDEEIISADRGVIAQERPLDLYLKDKFGRDWNRILYAQPEAERDPELIQKSSTHDAYWALRCLLDTKKDFYGQGGLSFHYFVDWMACASMFIDPDYEFKMTSILKECIEESGRSSHADRIGVSAQSAHPVHEYLAERFCGSNPPIAVMFRFMIRCCREAAYLPAWAQKLVDQIDILHFGSDLYWSVLTNIISQVNDAIAASKASLDAEFGSDWDGRLDDNSGFDAGVSARIAEYYSLHALSCLATRNQRFFEQDEKPFHQFIDYLLLSLRETSNAERKLGRLLEECMREYEASPYMPVTLIRR